MRDNSSSINTSLSTTRSNFNLHEFPVRFESTINRTYTNTDSYEELNRNWLNRDVSQENLSNLTIQGAQMPQTNQTTQTRSNNQNLNTEINNQIERLASTNINTPQIQQDNREYIESSTSTRQLNQLDEIIERHDQEFLRIVNSLSTFREENIASEGI